VTLTSGLTAAEPTSSPHRRRLTATGSRRHRPGTRFSVTGVVVALVLATLSLVGVPFSGVAAAASPPAWQVTPTPDPGFHYGSVAALSCASSTFCVGVGSRTQSAVVPLLDTWNGTKWVTVDLALPAGAVTGSWAAVSCPSTSFCMAVGTVRADITSPTSPDIPLSATWNGQVWTVSNPLPAVRAKMDGVSCQAEGSCLVVGQQTTRYGAGRTFSVAFDGQGWGPQSTIPRPFSWYLLKTAELHSVTCLSAANCYVAGRQVAGQLGVRGAVQAIPYLAHWNGTSWKLQTVPARFDNNKNVSSTIAGVACPSATLCLAVGGAIGGTGLLNLRNGVWVKAPDNGTQDDSFDAISCSSATSCLATGTGPDPVQARWDGTRWTVTAAVAQVTTLSCLPSGSCIGTSSDPTTGVVTSYVIAPGGPWQAYPFAVPAGIGQSSLTKVSCATGTNCTAVGKVGSKDLVERWNGTGWSLLPTLGAADIQQIDCPTVDVCVAIGTDYSTSPYTQVSGVLKAGQWTPVAFPMEGTLLSCASATSCVAVGGDGTGQVAARFNGTSWVSIANPGADLTGLDCPTASFCMAVGTTSSETGHLGYSTTWNGSTWTPRARPTDASGYVTMGKVSCATTTYCLAFGTADFSEQIERWNGATWTAVAVDVTAVNNVSEVSCASATRCVLMGDTGSLVLTGTTWTLVPWAAGRSGYDDLEGLACASDGTCMAVGTRSVDINPDGSLRALTPLAEVLHP
jgi:hypothetical protein